MPGTGSDPNICSGKRAGVHGMSTAGESLTFYGYRELTLR